MDVKALTEKDGKPSFSRKTGAWVVGVMLGLSIVSVLVAVAKSPATATTSMLTVLIPWLTFAGSLYGIAKHKEARNGG